MVICNYAYLFQVKTKHVNIFRWQTLELEFFSVYYLISKVFKL